MSPCWTLPGINNKLFAHSFPNFIVVAHVASSCDGTQSALVQMHCAPTVKRQKRSAEEGTQARQKLALLYSLI